MAEIAGSRATTNYINDTKANKDTAKVTTKTKISDSDKKKLQSMVTSKQDKVKILKKYGLENDEATRKTYKVDRSLTNAEIRSLKSPYISETNKMAILKKKGLNNNANVLKEYKIDQNAVGKPNDYEDQYRGKINDLSGQLEGFNKNYEKYSSKYTPLIEQLQQSLVDGSFYDPETDARAQAYRNEFTRGAEQSRDSTMARLAALNGGLGSTSIQAAAQQAYDNRMGQLATKLLDLRDLAEASVRNNISGYWNLENDAYGKYNDAYNKAYGNLSDALANYKSLSDTDRARYLQDVNTWENYRAYMENKRQFDDDMKYRYAALEAQAEARQPSVNVGGNGNGNGNGNVTNTTNNNNGTSTTYTPTGKTAPYVYGGQTEDDDKPKYDDRGFRLNY